MAAAAAAAAAAPGPPEAPAPAPAGPAPPGPGALPPVRLSVVRLARNRSPPGGAAERSRVCCNLGRELHFYGGAGAGGRGSRRSLDLHRPIDKRVYKGTQPTCHDFNQFTAGAETLALLVGFSAGQVQYLDLAKKDSAGRLFNEERLIDKSKVTLVRWLPDTERLFLASHASGHLYLYDSEQPCSPTTPQYTLLTQGEGFRVFSSKSKTPRNPLLKWAVGSGPLNEFAFSPDGRWLACVSQDGVLRVFHFSSMLLQGMMRSYFGGLLCVCWSPDGRYVVTGGEDDLVTVWSLAEGRVVARGHGHKSWVNAVAFDPFTGGRGETPETRQDPPGVAYRFGSAGQDTQFCLWDLTEDVLESRGSLPRPRPAPGDPQINPSGLPRSLSRSNSLPQTGGGPQISPRAPPALSAGRFATLTPRDPRGGAPEKEQHKRYHSLGNISRGGGNAEKTPPGGGPGGSRGSLDMAKVLGTALCPRLNEVPLLEPLVCKKIAQERLTVLLFLEDCIVTACQEGLICTWARPGVSGLASQNGGSPSGTVV
ncbi:PREDICTED: dystrophia myotonica WD repeat-containing protein [Pseudopodoces humilis]|uniref:dystrophia myotonica WD repeat-containing protein n=1 Tax=Pseudopodoces humilis TaxID=181119 RepID=UPI0006B72F1B|nr:PREDICTED: dystrophia myotonica WD repeat-containing protein [Pseudopodoces humilis]